MSDLAPFVASAIRDRTVAGLMEENRILRETLQNYPPSEHIAGEVLTIRVRDLGPNPREEIRFTISYNTRMQRIFDEVARSISVPIADLRFFFNEERFHDGTATPSSLSMRDQAIIDLKIREFIRVVLSDPRQDERKKTYYKVCKHVKMKVVFSDYANRIGAEVSNLQFFLNGKQVFGNNMASSLQLLNEEDCIDVMPARESLPIEIASTESSSSSSEE